MAESLTFAFALGAQVRWVEPSDVPAITTKRQQPYRVVGREWHDYLHIATQEWYLLEPWTRTTSWIQDRPVRVHRRAVVAWEEEHHG